MEKTAEAFRTISEVADDLALPQHVLRFWETRFPQIRPLKRAGGRRYYRPADVALLRAIRQLLHERGYTIKGVQKLLKEQGVRGLRDGDTPPDAIDLGGPDEEASGEVEDAQAAPSAPVEAIDVGPSPEDDSLEAHVRRPAASERATLADALAAIDEAEAILAGLGLGPAKPSDGSAG